jgi:hypothetical protein
MIERLQGTRVKIGNIIQISLFGFFIIINKIGVASLRIDPQYVNVLEIWVASNAIYFSYVILKRPFTTPHVKDVKSPQCSTPMRSIILKCGVCGAIFDLSGKH